jgi:hypothetical protein
MGVELLRPLRRLARRNSAGGGTVVPLAVATRARPTGDGPSVAWAALGRRRLSRLDTLSGQEARAVVAGRLLPLDGILQYRVRVVWPRRRHSLSFRPFLDVRKDARSRPEARHGLKAGGTAWDNARDRGKHRRQRQRLAEPRTSRRRAAGDSFWARRRWPDGRPARCKISLVSARACQRRWLSLGGTARGTFPVSPQRSTAPAYQAIERGPAAGAAARRVGPLPAGSPRRRPRRSRLRCPGRRDGR